MVVGAEVKKEVKGAEGGTEAVEWWQGRAKLSPDLRDDGRGARVEVEVPQMALAPPVKAERPRTASGGSYGGISGTVRGSSAPQDATSVSSARYAPYRYPATTSALASYPSTLPSPSHLHPQLAHSQNGSLEQYAYFTPTSHHQHQHQQLPRLSTTFAYPPPAALAPHSAATYHLPPPLPTSTHYPRFEGGAPISRSVSAPERSTSWELPSASVEAEGGRLWLGMGMGLGHSVSSIRGEVVPVPVARAGGQGWVSAMGGAQPNAGGGAGARGGGGGGSVRLPPLAMMDSLPPRPPRPTLITQSDLLSHAWATNLSHPNYATSDPHRHQHHLTSSSGSTSSASASASTSPQSGVSSSSGFFHQVVPGQGQSVSPPVMLTTMMCARNEETMEQLALAASKVAEGEEERL